MNKKIAIILVSESGMPIAQKLTGAFPEATVYSKSSMAGCLVIESYRQFLSEHFDKFDTIIFIGAMGICVRSIAHCIKNKYSDPAIICIDSCGHFAISVLAGHIGGANETTRRIAAIIGGKAVITTQSDNLNIWALDTLGRDFNWRTETDHSDMNQAITLFVNRKSTALLLDVKNHGTTHLEQSFPEHVKIFYRFEDIDFQKFELLIAVTPFIYRCTIPTLYFRPRTLHIGLGCRKNCSPDGIAEHIETVMKKQSLSPLSICSISTIELKKDEPLFQHLAERWGTEKNIFSADDLRGIEVPNPSEKVFETTGIYGVSEAAALKASNFGAFLLEKQKGMLNERNDFTFSVTFDAAQQRRGFIEIIGAGPGDPELVSVRGKRLLEKADLILYAGSLVPQELTFYAKPDATVRSSADMTLEEQFSLMKEFYDKGLLIVRLHTGDPCIYGAIQEQMAFFDQAGMDYRITPGISSFQAAAAALRSQFTIPEKVQTIILTRGEGRTPIPEKEKLHLLAKSQSTMCIYLSATIANQVQEALLQEYPPETPVAICHKLTWKEERIYRGQLRNLANIVSEKQLTLTTLLVIGDAIDNRSGQSHLYSSDFKHLFRP